MQLRRFYCPEIPAPGEQVELSESESRHALGVLRLRPGDALLLLDGKGQLAEAQLLSASGGRVRHALCLVQQRQLCPRPQPAFRLYIAPPQGKSFEQVLRMAVELQCGRITPILCRHASAKPKGIAEKWLSILIAACKQSVNPYLPLVDEPVSFQDALLQARESAFFGAVPGLKKEAAGLLDDSRAAILSLALWVGPEGGFSSEEEAALLRIGCQPLTLGQAIMRVETAVPALFGMIQGLLQSRV